MLKKNIMLLKLNLKIKIVKSILRQEFELKKIELEYFYLKKYAQISVHIPFSNICFQLNNFVNSIFKHLTVFDRWENRQIPIFNGNKNNVYVICSYRHFFMRVKSFLDLGYTCTIGISKIVQISQSHNITE